MVGIVVHSAAIQDRDGAVPTLQSIRRFYPFLRHIFADGGYAGAKTQAGAEGQRWLGLSKSSGGATTPKASSFCRADGWWSAPLHGWEDAGAWQRIGRHQSKAQQHGHSSHTSEPSRGDWQDTVMPDKLLNQTLSSRTSPLPNTLCSAAISERHARPSNNCAETSSCVPSRTWSACMPILPNAHDSYRTPPLPR